MNKFELYLKTDQNNSIDFLFKMLETDYEKSDYLKKLGQLVTSEGMDIVTDWTKLILILIKVKDLNMCRSLLKNTKKLSHKQVADFIKEFGWDQLKNELNLLPATVDNVIENCAFVNVRLF